MNLPRPYLSGSRSNLFTTVTATGPQSRERQCNRQLLGKLGLPCCRHRYPAAIAAQCPSFAACRATRPQLHASWNHSLRGRPTILRRRLRRRERHEQQSPLLFTCAATSHGIANRYGRHLGISLCFHGAAIQVPPAFPWGALISCMRVSGSQGSNQWTRFHERLSFTRQPPVLFGRECISAIWPLRPIASTPGTLIATISRNHMNLRPILELWTL